MTASLPCVCALGLCLLALTGCTPGGCQPANLLRNATLSDGILSPTGWGVNASRGNRVTWQESADGQGAAVLLEGSGRDWAGLSSHRVPVTPGDTLSVGARMRVLPGGDATDIDRLFIRFFRAGRFVGQSGPSLANLTGEWQPVLGAVAVPAEADSADVSVQIRSTARVQVAGCLLSLLDLAQAGALLPPAPPDVAWRTVERPRSLPPDGDGNGLRDRVEQFLGIRPEDGAIGSRRTRAKTTSLQTPTGYRGDNDLKVDIVIIAGNAEEKIRSWGLLGYEPHVMVGFRAGSAYLDGREDGTPHRDEVQTDAGGRLLTCGPGSYYMVPTENRRRIFREYFREAVRRGAKAACPEEPEFFSRAGYSEAFKRLWRERYGEPWQDQATSVAARFKSERLKVGLERELLQACWGGAREADPGVKRFLLAHSPLSYTAWGITFGHHDALATGEADAMVAQVWTGTARTSVRYEGIREERTFENAYLEYASCVGLTRDKEVELWFLMDPLEDNPDRSMEDYRSNYFRTLAASLMFPEVTRFETMPWPTRIFGRVPDDFATVIGSVINVLSDMQNQEEVAFDAGSGGIGTFLSDSAMWQRGAPHGSDMDCFYGLAMPLLMHGVPVGVPHLDRVTDPGYLDAYRLLLVSYDMLKPMRPEINRALADWVAGGGCLVVFGGSDPYNQVPEWWRERGFASPQDHLLSLCGYDVSGRQVVPPVGRQEEWQAVATTDYAGRNLENRDTVEIDLSPFLAEGAALVKCEDSMKGDGWGPLITRLEIEGVRGGKEVSQEITANTPQERALILVDRDSGVNPEGFRFCDRDSYVVYRLEFDADTPAKLRIEIGNQYLVSAAPGSAAQAGEFRAASGPPALGVEAFRPPASEDLVVYEGSNATALYSGPAGALVQERTHGKGTCLFAGVSPSWFATSRPAAEALRALVRYAMEAKLGGEHREPGYLKMRRGRYVVARSLTEGLELTGRFVDVLKANLPVLDRAELEAGRLAVLCDAGQDMDGPPHVLFTSSCLEWQAAEAQRSRLILSGAEGTTGACRIYSGGRAIASASSMAADGGRVTVEREPAGDTVLLRYPNHPHGLGIDITWGDGQ